MEAAFLLALQSIRIDGLTQLIVLISALGNRGFIWAVFAVIMLFFHQKRPTGIILIAALILTAILSELVIGPIVGRVRPCDAGIGVFAVAGVSHPGYSFPSTHTALSFAAASVIGMTLGKRFGMPAVILAVLIGFSRLYLGVHYPSDVIVGAALGIAIGIALSWVFLQLFANAMQRWNTPPGRHSAK